MDTSEFFDRNKKIVIHNKKDKELDYKRYNDNCKKLKRLLKYTDSRLNKGRIGKQTNKHYVWERSRTCICHTDNEINNTIIGIYSLLRDNKLSVKIYFKKNPFLVMKKIRNRVKNKEAFDFFDIKIDKMDEKCLVCKKTTVV